MDAIEDRGCDPKIGSDSLSAHVGVDLHGPIQRLGWTPSPRLYRDAQPNMAGGAQEKEGAGARVPSFAATTNTSNSPYRSRAALGRREAPPRPPRRPTPIPSLSSAGGGPEAAGICPSASAAGSTPHRPPTSSAPLEQWRTRDLPPLRQTRPTVYAPLTSLSFLY
jgi:hypothetical protein